MKVNGTAVENYISWVKLCSRIYYKRIGIIPHPLQIFFFRIFKCYCCHNPIPLFFFETLFPHHKAPLPDQMRLGIIPPVQVAKLSITGDDFS